MDLAISPEGSVIKNLPEFFSGFAYVLVLDRPLASRFLSENHVRTEAGVW
jgi:hypothetical protein